MRKTDTIETRRQARSPQTTTVIHFVDVERLGAELRPICGAWSENVTWTTVRSVMTCPACARLLRVARPERRPAAPQDAKHSGS